jgi:hypothetical protein
MGVLSSLFEGWLMKKRSWWQRRDDEYPEDWEEMSRAFRASRGYICEHCGVQQGTVRVSRAGNEYTARVAAAHKYPNDTQNPYPELLCLCERCHFAYDARFREIIEEGKHQALLHAIVLERYWGVEYDEEGEGYEDGSEYGWFANG